MAVSCDVQTVKDNAICFTCESEKTLVGLQTYLLGQILIASNPMADVSVQALKDASTCFRDCISSKELYGAMAYLLCQIEAAGGGGGGGNSAITEGAGAPVNGVPSTTWFYVDTNTYFKYWNIATLASPVWIV